MSADLRAQLAGLAQCVLLVVAILLVLLAIATLVGKWIAEGQCYCASCGQWMPEPELGHRRRCVNPHCTTRGQ